MFLYIVVIIPNLLELLLMNPVYQVLIFGRQIHDGFTILVHLSLYYMPVASIFGKSLFVTETVIMPEGVVGILVSAATYSVPFLLWWIFVIRTNNNL